MKSALNDPNHSARFFHTPRKPPHAYIFPVTPLARFDPCVCDPVSGEDSVKNDLSRLRAPFHGHSWVPMEIVGEHRMLTKKTHWNPEKKSTILRETGP